MVSSEKETGGFLAPSITVLANKGWKGNATVEKCQKEALKIKFSFEKILSKLAKFKRCNSPTKV